MISYEPLFKTMKEKKITEYQLIFKYGMSANTTQRFRHGMAIRTSTINELCEILQCGVGDIITYVPDSKLSESKYN